MGFLVVKSLLMHLWHAMVFNTSACTINLWKCQKYYYQK